MKLKILHGAIQETQADTLIVNLFDDVSTPSGATGAVDSALGGAISELIASGDLTGKAGEVGVLYPRGAIPATRVLVAGMGKRDAYDLEGVRKTAASAINRAHELGAKKVASIVHGAGVAGLPAADAAQAVTEATLLTLYEYDAPKQRSDEKKAIASFTLAEFDEAKLADIESGLQTGKAIAAGAILARDLVNMPPNVATPSKLADTARQIAAAYGMGITTGGRKWAAARNMGAFLAVAKGAGEKPKFIILEHNGDRDDLDTIVLVGKGITFDTGGISIKPSANMGAMKSDMGGAAAVLGAMKAVGMLDLPLRIIGITPCTENMPDADAYRPADVITASNGKTIEIISTDAEGRMVLADGLVYAAQYAPKAVVDLATLTGSCVVALGRGVAAGLFSTDDSLRDKLFAAGQNTQERVWPLPLYEDYRRTIDSDVADMMNSGGRMGGVGTSAIFLHEFTDYPWAHLDIAGVALSEKSQAYTPKGATGFGVRLLVEFLRNW
ncbi:MAG: leucyl aminopeptidase [Ardenticatenaceae bacterium]|nr:leucyl aminopeptidase [Ardenticatenaceae bacterium]MCB8989723.1 leucyl aminopeptidase [Ardenticatenaceae bacterium]MCB9002818.1 leucyl aminopeptidase [Ardenticatenaceae bacterium]